MSCDIPRDQRQVADDDFFAAMDLTWKDRRNGITATASRRLRNGGKLRRAVEFRHGFGWTVQDRVLQSPGQPHRLLWHFEPGVELTRDGDSFLACAGKSGLRIGFESSSRLRVKIRREPPMPSDQGSSGWNRPWVLEVFFGGGAEDEVTTRFAVMHGSKGAQDEHDS